VPRHGAAVRILEADHSVADCVRPHRGGDANRLTDDLHATEREPPQPQNRADYTQTWRSTW